MALKLEVEPLRFLRQDRDLEGVVRRAPSAAAADGCPVVPPITFLKYKVQARSYQWACFLDFPRKANLRNAFAVVCMLAMPCRVSAKNDKVVWENLTELQAGRRFESSR
jgi:hypothetical protein